MKTRRRRRLLRDETIAPWATIAILLALWWGASYLLRREAPAPAAVGNTSQATPEAQSRSRNTPQRAAVDASGANNGVEARNDAIRAVETGGTVPVVPVAGIDASSLTSTFNEVRGGGARRHEAMDILAPRGTPVVASVDGRIVKLFTSAAGGLTIYQFDAEERFCYYYAHLDAYAPDLTEGQEVRRGQILGFVGTTGNAPPDTPHLHFAIYRLKEDKRWWEGEPLDPIQFLR